MLKRQYDTKRDKLNTALTSIPSIGKRGAFHLNNIGVFCVEDLINANAEDLYSRDTLFKGLQDDRCLLYQYRCAVYYANNKSHDLEKLKWWNWKDENDQSK